MAIAIFVPDYYMNYIEKAGNMLFEVPMVDGRPTVEFNTLEYPHWHIVLSIHLGRAFPSETIERNINKLANCSKEKLVEHIQDGSLVHYLQEQELELVSESRWD